MKISCIVFFLLLIEFSSQSQTVCSKEADKVISFVIDSLCIKKCKGSKIYISEELRNSDMPFCASLNMLPSTFDTVSIQKHFSDTSLLLIDIKKNAQQGVNFFKIVPQVYYEQVVVKEGHATTKDCLYFFANPFFMDNNRVCLFAYATHLGRSSVLLLKKRKGKWNIASVLCEVKANTII